MVKMNRSRILAMVLAVILVASGCTAGGNVQRRPITITNDAPEYVYDRQYWESRYALEHDYLAGRPATLRSMVNATPDVLDSSVLIDGHTVYVGFIAQKGTADIDRMKRAIASRVRAFDDTITTVYVSEDTSFYERIRRISIDTGGITSNEIRGQLQKMVANMTPQKL